MSGMLLKYFWRDSSKFHKYVLPALSTISLVVTILTGVLAVYKSFPGQSEKEDYVTYLFVANLVLHFILIVIAYFLDHPKEIEHDPVNIEYLDKDRSELSFFGIKSESDIKTRFEDANEGVSSYFTKFRHIWIGWLFLYSVIGFDFYSEKNLNPSATPEEKIEGLSIQYQEEQFIYAEKEGANFYWKVISPVLTNAANNITTIFFILSFLILTQEFDRRNPRNPRNPRPKETSLCWLLFFVLLLFEIGFRVFDISKNNGSNYFILNIWFSILSGALAMIAIARLVGRLDSMLITPDKWVLNVLYGYAGLQLFLRDYVAGGSEYLRLTVMYIALFSKVVLLMFTVSLIGTNRLFFYFLATRKIQGYMRNQWIAIKEIFIPVDAKINSDIDGSWTITEKYYKDNKVARSTTGILIVKTSGNQLSGEVTLEDSLKSSSNSESFKVKQLFKGNQDGREVHIKCTKYEILGNSTKKQYNKDSWTGERVNENTIIGTSDDKNNSEGKVIFKRIPEETIS